MSTRILPSMLRATPTLTAVLCLFLLISTDASAQKDTPLKKVHINPSNRLYTSTDGRVHVFHGLAIEDSSPPWTLATYDADQIELMKTWGLNAVRVGFQWHMVEPSTGVYNDTYVQELVDFISLLNDHGVYAILDMHQDCWSPLFCEAHGIPSQYSKGYSTDYDPGGSKAYPQPVLAPQYDKNRHITNCGEVGKHIFGWSTCYVTYAVGTAAQRLYDNDQGILDRFGKFWQLVASKVKKYPNVLGYELINEPWLGNVPLDLKDLFPDDNPHPPDLDLWLPGVADRKNMQRMYKALHKYIRAVDNDSIIFFEPATGGNFLDAFAAGFESGPGGVEYNDRQAMSYHVYCPSVDLKNASDLLKNIVGNLSILSCDLLNDEMYNVRKNDTDRLKLGGFLTEFGKLDDETQTDLKDKIDFATMKMDEFKHGWTYWYLTPNPSVPNTEEITALARPFPHKIAGNPEFYSYNPTTKTFQLKYTPCTVAPCKDLPTEVFISSKYAYAGVQYSIKIEPNGNKVRHSVDNSSQMLLINVDTISPNEPISVNIFPE